MTRVSKLADCGTIENEYWAHVSAQPELPIALADEAIETEDRDIQYLGELIGELREEGADNVEKVKDYTLNNPEVISDLRKLVATSDKRLYLDLSYIFSRTPHPTNRGSTLCGCLPHELTRHSTSFFINMIRRRETKPELATAAVDVISKYLLERGLGDSLDLYKTLPADQIETIFQYLIDPKEAQQNEAKRRGHGAEGKLAELLYNLGCNFYPADKHLRPLGKHDPNINLLDFTISERDTDSTFSSDLVLINKKQEVIACVVGLIHSSDPGQFGVDKSDTVGEIREAMDKFNEQHERKVQLWGLVDGVGFSENKSGTIHKMLPHFHTFIQMKSLYKAALSVHELGQAAVRGIKFDEEFYSPQSIKQMSSYVPNGIEIIVGDTTQKRTEINAGMASIYI